MVDNRSTQRRFKVWKWTFIILMIAGAATVGGGVWYMKVAEKSLAQLATAIERDKVRAGKAYEETLAIRATRDLDMEFVVSNDLVRRLLEEMKGYRQISRRGDLYILDKVRVQFHKGFWEVEVEGRYEGKRFPLSGQVKARYFAFTYITDMGHFGARLAIADAQPVSGIPAWLTVIKPWLLLRLQSRLSLRDVTLPLGLDTEISIPEQEKAIEAGFVHTPAMKMTLAIDQARAFTDRDETGVLISRIQLGETLPDQAAEDGPAAKKAILPYSLHLDQGKDARLILRAGVIDQLLQGLIQQPVDITVHIPHLPNVWQKTTKVFGRKIENHLDLRKVQGAVDITEAGFVVKKEGLNVMVRLKGQFDGVLAGEVLGVDFQKPVQVFPSVDEEVPATLTPSDKGLIFALEDREIKVDLDIHTELMGRTVKLHWPLKLETQRLMQPVHIPTQLFNEVRVPVEVHRKKILQTKKLAFSLDWTLILPQEQGQGIALEGRLGLPKDEMEAAAPR